jgi:hypothetical protein
MTWRISPLGAAGRLVGLALNGWLLAVVLTEMWPDGPAPVDKAEWSLGLSAAALNAAGRQPVDAYRQILARPLFFKSRLPFVPPPPPAPPPAPIAAPPPAAVDPGIALGGVMMKDNIKKAYVFSKAGTGGAWASEGEEFMGWKVTAIDRAGTRLEQRGRSIDLQLYPRE